MTRSQGEKLNTDLVIYYHFTALPLKIVKVLSLD